MLSIRMRASRRSGGREVHISGAEGIFAEADFPRTARQYIRRATSHPRGRPHRIVITVERLSVEPRPVSALPVATLGNTTVRGAEALVTKVLLRMGVSPRAAAAGLRVVTSGEAMRGAALVEAVTGRRCEPDRHRGVRASRIGITRDAARRLGQRLSRLKINTDTVKEALVLASKVAACPSVVAELCVSDDPDYTTGYVASRGLGYLRIPNIKEMGSRCGGRVFFIDGTGSAAGVAAFLEREPVMVAEVSACRGTVIPDEIIGLHHR